MGRMLLEELAGKKPQGRRNNNASLEVIYSLVREHLAEIEEAYARGYSWRQIDESCRRVWQEESDKASGIAWWSSGLMICDCYKAVKHNTKARQKKPAIAL